MLNETFSNNEQPLNENSPISINDEGIEIYFKWEQPKKVEIEMVSTNDGISKIIWESEVPLLNENSPISFIDDGIKIFVNE